MEISTMSRPRRWSQRRRTTRGISRVGLDTPWFRRESRNGMSTIRGVALPDFFRHVNLLFGELLAGYPILVLLIVESLAVRWAWGRSWPKTFGITTLMNAVACWLGLLIPFTAWCLQVVIALVLRPKWIEAPTLTGWLVASTYFVLILALLKVRVLHLLSIRVGRNRFFLLLGTNFTAIATAYFGAASR